MGGAERTNVTADATLTSGASFWTTETVGHEFVAFADGPHGVRAQDAEADHLGISPSRPATCFPPASGLAQSWDPTLVERVGEALGREAAHHDVDVLLGPGVNIKRDPRGGRNFEYYSEDPFLSGVLGAAWVTGVQSQHVGASVKHFAANSCETDRMRSDSRVDERTLREIYLPAFRRVVQESHPWTVMCSYNRINGVYAAENRWLLTTLLREEWGFEGAVISDWGAVRDRVAALDAGLDLAMPGGDESSDAAVQRAAEEGRLDQAVLHDRADRVRELVARATRGRVERGRPELDVEAHHDLAREAAARSIVLLQNDGTLPLNTTTQVAVIGRFAAEPRYQGGGSSHVNPTTVDIPLDAIGGIGNAVSYAEGWAVGSVADATLLNEAVGIARDADVAIVFLGLDEGDESEGFDRSDIQLPAAQLAVLAAVADAQRRVVAVLSHGGLVDLTDVALRASAIIDGGLLGQGGGNALAAVLFGALNPSGRLAESVPRRLADAPAFLSFPEEDGQAWYGEGVFVGYRWYDARGLDVLYPFGHGLSYTTFAYSKSSVKASTEGIKARVTVTNSGSREGREVVQLYVGRPGGSRRNPLRELKAFVNVSLKPGESRVIEFTVPREDIAGWDVRSHSWIVEGGDYTIDIGASSRDLRASHVVEIEGDHFIPALSLASTMGEVIAHPVAGPILRGYLAASSSQTESASAALGSDVARMTASIPLDRLPAFTGGKFDVQGIMKLIAAANQGGIPHSQDDPIATEARQK